MTEPGAPEAPDREACAELDRADDLAFARRRFFVPEGIVYLDGNSLGAMPVGVPSRLASEASVAWAEGLIGSWNQAGWIHLPQRLGARIAPLIGARADEVLVADSTSINLHKLLTAALLLQEGRTEVVTEAGNFPTDRYMIDGAIGLMGRGHRCVVVPSPADEEAIIAALGPRTAVAVLTQVDYRTGRRLDMARINRAAAERGSLVLWDLAHSAGAFPVDLGGDGAQLAIGCSYKFLNGGPGAPAFLFVAQGLQAALPSALPGWLGHAEPFAFEPSYRPADGLRRHQVGTPPVLAMAALDAALDAFEGVDMGRLRDKSVRLMELFIRRALERLGDAGLELASPADPSRRGSQVAFRHPLAFAMMQALIERGVVGDFREPDILRFGFAPLYLRFVDVWDAVERWADVLASRTHLEARHGVRGVVT